MCIRDRFYIDVGNLPKIKAEQYLRDVMNRYRNKLVYDANTGEIRDDKKHMSMLEDFWLPRREGGRGTEISTLPGGQNLGELKDVEYFRTKLFKSLNLPLVDSMEKKDLVSEEVMRFFVTNLSFPSSSVACVKSFLFCLMIF